MCVMVVVMVGEGAGDVKGEGLWEGEVGWACMSTVRCPAQHGTMPTFVVKGLLHATTLRAGKLQREL